MDQRINAGYLLEMAQRIERNGADFYRMAATYVRDTDTSQLMLNLSAMESSHERIFADMAQRLPTQRAGGDLDIGSETALYIKGLLAGRFFDIRATPADFLRRADSPRDVILTAIGLEKETLAFYEGIKGLIAESDRPVVETVLREEMRHVSQLAGALEP